LRTVPAFFAAFGFGFDWAFAFGAGFVLGLGFALAFGFGAGLIFAPRFAADSVFAGLGCAPRGLLVRFRSPSRAGFGAAGRAFMLGSPASARPRRVPVTRSISRSWLTSLSSQNEMATPERPALAVRPMRCT